MSNTEQMLRSHPAQIDLDLELLARATDAATACAQTCSACADACLSEEMVAQLTKCIRTDLDCADVCATTARLLSRHPGYDANLTRAQLQACIAACRACGDECDQHRDMHEHCRLCADACHECEAACSALLATITE